MPEHVHILLGIPTTMTISKAAQQIKGGSSKWIKDAIPNKKGFAWQDGDSRGRMVMAHLQSANPTFPK